jgi:hypothetical protein
VAAANCSASNGSKPDPSCLQNAVLSPECLEFGDVKIIWQVCTLAPISHPPKNRRQYNLGKAVGKATLVANENRREFSPFRRLPALCGAFFMSAFQFSAFQLYQTSPFPRPPVRPNGRFKGLPQKANS